MAGSYFGTAALMTYGFTARQVRQRKCHATERLTKGWQRKLCEMRERLPMQIKGTVYKDGKFWLIELSKAS